MTGSDTLRTLAHFSLPLTLLCLLLVPVAIVAGQWLKMVVLLAAAFVVFASGHACAALADVREQTMQIKRYLAANRPRPRNLAPDAPAPTPVEKYAARRMKIHADATDHLTDVLYTRRWNGKAQQAVRPTRESPADTPNLLSPRPLTRTRR